MPGSFFDTNIVLYLIGPDQSKALRAEDLLRTGGSISTQVLNESASVLRRKRKMPWSDVVAFLTELRDGLEVYPFTIETHDKGLRLAERYGFAIYDAMIVASALDAECNTLWSEDMQDGLLVEGELRIANPFASA